MVVMLFVGVGVGEREFVDELGGKGIWVDGERMIRVVGIVLMEGCEIGVEVMNVWRGLGKEL